MKIFTGKQILLELTHRDKCSMRSLYQKSAAKESFIHAAANTKGASSA